MDILVLGKMGVLNRIEGWMLFGWVFEILVWGCWYVVMGVN